MIRYLLAIVAGCCLLNFRIALADDAAPFAMPKQYSAEMTTTTPQGTNVASKTFVDQGKIRSEMSTQGMQMVSIIRPDQQKMYSVMVSQKMVMVMPLNPEQVKKYAAAGGAGEGSKYEAIGPDTVNGIACTKYKMTTSDNKEFFMWVDAAKKIPVQMAATDGSFNLLWKNFQTGPQDAALFEPPADYQKMEMPAAAAH